LEFRNYLSLFKSLGFSPNQAKVYLTLITLGDSSAKSIGNYSEVAREEVYRKLRELEKKGFIKRIFTKPAMFRASPLECVLSTLLRTKAERLSKLSEDSEKMLLSIKEIEEYRIQNFPEIVFIPEKNILLNKAEEELKSMKKSLDTICTWKKGMGWLTTHYDFFVDAINRKVKIRFIIEQKKEQKYPKLVKNLKDNILFKIRPISTIPAACIGLYDNEKLLIDTSTKASFVESPALWVTNLDIVRMAQIYFETLWNNSGNHDLHE
jgi:sugar-specific transcriptional regulator TrmB